MTQEQAKPTSLIDSGGIEGSPVYSGDGTRIGTIRRLIIDRASGKVVYVVMTFVESFDPDNMTYVIPWAKLSYDKARSGYCAHITEAELRSALPAGDGVMDWSNRESEEELLPFFRVPAGWRSI